MSTTGCSGDCSSCSSNCEQRDLHFPENKYSTIKKVIGVVSGKGGVGKSLVTSLLAVAAQSEGKQTAIMDADVTGPSIPKAFGLHGRAEGDEDGIYPMLTKTGIRVMSVNLLLEKEDAPVIWRGPVISGMIQQFWQEVVWGDVDYMFIDMPPGTGDVPLTVFQSLPLDGIVIVTTPQDLVSLNARTAKRATRYSERAKSTRSPPNSACRCSRACPLTRKPPRWSIRARWSWQTPTPCAALWRSCKEGRVIRQDHPFFSRLSKKAKAKFSPAFFKRR